MSSINRLTEVLGEQDVNGSYRIEISSDIASKVPIKRVRGKCKALKCQNNAYPKLFPKACSKDEGKTMNNDRIDVSKVKVVEELKVTQNNSIARKRLVQTKTRNFFLTETKPGNNKEMSENISTSSKAEQTECEQSVSVEKLKNAREEKTYEILDDEDISTVSCVVLKSKKKSLKLSRKSKTTECVNLSSNSISDSLSNTKKVITPTQNTDSKKNSMDVFQVMMDNRKKSIGMNSPGKEKVHEDDFKEIEERREIKAKRSLSLSKWADAKGASKKKEAEELREEYLKHTLENRAKVFKTMLLNKSPREKIKHSIPSKLSDSEIFNVNSSDSNDNMRENVPTTLKSKKRFRDSKYNSEKSTTKKTKLQSSESSSTVSNVKISSAESNFVAKLFPPLKKKESMLSYFEKDEPKEIEEELVEVLYFEDILENKTDTIQTKPIQSKPKTKQKKKSKLRKKLETVVMDNLHTTLIKKEVKEKETCKSLKHTETLAKNATQKQTGLSEICEKEINGDSRPRRSARKPIKYIQESSESSDSEDYEIFSKIRMDKDKRKSKKTTNKENVLKNKERKNIENIVSPIKIVNLQSPGKLQCMRSPRTISLLKCDAAKTKSLAPLFKKCIPKPILDPSVIEARRLFLQSGVPDSIRIQMEKVTSIPIDVNFFPFISHVQQIPEDSDADFSVWKLPSKYISEDECSLSISNNQNNSSKHPFKNFINTKRNLESRKNCYEIFNELEILHYKEGLKIIKESFPEFPVYRTFKKLWEKYNLVPKLSGNDAESSKLNIDESSTNDDNMSKGGALWTEKYKPLSSSDILGNSRSVNSLKKWLESWKDYNEISANKVPKRSRRNSDSSSDFCNSDSESRDSMRLPSNLMVVTGPSGSGKTSGVYAVANELGINVLEVNASSKRTGKRILTELQEATQSHKVLTKMNSDNSSNCFNDFTKKVNNDNSKNKKLHKEKSNGKKSTKGPFKKINSGEILQNNCKLPNREICSQKVFDTNIMSLMLVDDADIVFEEDDGFIGALVQLVQTSKRPMLIITSDHNCAHLQRFMADNVVHFNPLSSKILGPWLDILVLIECNRIIPKLSSMLLEFNQGDIRNTILQLQFWILGSKESSKENVGLRESCLIDENSSSFPSDGCLDDDSNSSWLTNDWKQNQNKKVLTHKTVDKGNEFNKINNLLISELSELCGIENNWFNIPHIFINSEDNCTISNYEKSKQLQDLQSAFDVFDSMSAIDVMRSYNKLDTQGIKLPWNVELKDSLSEAEDFSMYKYNEYLSSAWCQYMFDNSMGCAEKLFNLDGNQQSEIAFSKMQKNRDRQKNTVAHLEFSEAIWCGAQLDRTSVSLDYMAILRNICRSEEDRSKKNLKRNNRFYHYLNSLSSNGKEKLYEHACSTLKFE